MTSKERRQMAIREILLSSTGSSQEQIKEDLERRGISASQATLSRDLHEMGAVKAPVGGKGALYRIGGTIVGDEIRSAAAAFVVGYETVGNFLVIRTAPGNAQGFCVALDRQRWSEIVGTVAGDDTILVIARSSQDIESIEHRLNESTGRKKE
jgi:transcriptional regulator of arginine metabolism